MLVTSSNSTHQPQVHYSHKNVLSLFTGFKLLYIFENKTMNVTISISTEINTHFYKYCSLTSKIGTEKKGKEDTWL